MAGTLSLLAQAGFEPHMMNLSHSNLDSNALSEPEITRIRRREAERSANVIDASYHPPIADKSMRQSNAEVAQMSGHPNWEYAEGFRQHSHVGFSTSDRDLLAELLGDQRVCRPS